MPLHFWWGGKQLVCCTKNKLGNIHNCTQAQNWHIIEHPELEGIIKPSPWLHTSTTQIQIPSLRVVSQCSLSSSSSRSCPLPSAAVPLPPLSGAEYFPHTHLARPWHSSMPFHQSSSSWCSYRSTSDKSATAALSGDEDPETCFCDIIMF